VAGPALAATVRAQLAYRFKKPDQPPWWTISRMACTEILR
jgi:hypothetical protein